MRSLKEHMLLAERAYTPTLRRRELNSHRTASGERYVGYSFFYAAPHPIEHMKLFEVELNVWKEPLDWDNVGEPTIDMSFDIASDFYDREKPKLSVSYLNEYFDWLFDLLYTAADIHDIRRVSITPATQTHERLYESYIKSLSTQGYIESWSRGVVGTNRSFIVNLAI